MLITTSPKPFTLPMSCHLPLEARMALARAAETPIPKADPMARVKAIEDATARVKASFPELFKDCAE